MASLRGRFTPQCAHFTMSSTVWLCAGVLVGGFLQMAVPAGVLVREGWRPRLDFSLSPGMREIGRLMLPGLWGTAIYQVNLYVSQMLALSLNDLRIGGQHLLKFDVIDKRSGRNAFQHCARTNLEWCVL